MHRDHQQQAEFRSERSHARKEWGRSGADPHPTEGRDDHTRHSPKAQKSYGIRDAEAQRQIRELRGRY